MRTLLVLLVALATGCLDTTPETGEASQDLTFYTPHAAIVARIAGARKAADDLRALAASSRPPVFATWAVYNDYRNLVQFDYDSADQLDTYADFVEERDRLANDKDALDTTSQQEMLRLQATMEKKAQLEGMLSNALKAMHDTTCSIIDNLKA